MGSLVPTPSRGASPGHAPTSSGPGSRQQARALQQSEAFAGYRQRRVVVEHRLARLVQLGIRQARYFGRVKTKFQLYLAATVANLTLVASKAGLPEDKRLGSGMGIPLLTTTIKRTSNQQYLRSSDTSGHQDVLTS